MRCGGSKAARLLPRKRHKRYGLFIVRRLICGNYPLHMTDFTPGGMLLANGKIRFTRALAGDHLEERLGDARLAEATRRRCGDRRAWAWMDPEARICWAAISASIGYRAFGWLNDSSTILWVYSVEKHKTSNKSKDVLRAAKKKKRRR